VTFSVDVDDKTREAINAYYGLPGKATRDEVREYFVSQGLDNGLESLADFEEVRP
jgi:hypothetical protein